ncbi:MAG: type 2 isopentenyl-diphosphate Delta-isomerase, partial [Thermoplasmata archaeon]|nr:type 2 isopentenyl-diphosphate Delta-isomerase [Thermoplasmata archaeon]
MERKKDHIDIVLNEDVKSEHNYWDDIKLVHQALPELDLDEIDTSVELFGKELHAPLIISAMTGGFEDAKTINKNLAEAASELRIGMGVGSQRAALEDDKWEETYGVVKDFDVPLMIANLGAPQFIRQKDREPYGLDEAVKAMEMVDADILAIHLNYLQEVVQPEGDSFGKGCLLAIKKLALKLPILVKETGAGISNELAVELKKCGVIGIDVGGLGGTSFSAVEYYRAKNMDDKKRSKVGSTFWNWGIPTPVSLVLADVGLPLIATGGVRSGLDVARAVVLG